MGVHLRGAFLMTRAAQKHFVEQKYGKIIRPLQRLRARQPRPGQLLRRQDGHPGLHPHPGHRARALRHQRQRDRARLHRHRHDRRHRRPGRACRSRSSARPPPSATRSAGSGYPEDIAAAAAFLCSDEASYITGQTLYVDGGAKLVCLSVRTPAVRRAASRSPGVRRGAGGGLGVAHGVGGHPWPRRSVVGRRLLRAAARRSPTSWRPRACCTRGSRRSTAAPSTRCSRTLRPRAGSRRAGPTRSCCAPRSATPRRATPTRLP